jgi:hypothetical protein
MMPRVSVVLVSLLIGASAAWAQPPTSVGGEFQVNTYTTNYQEHPSAGVSANGKIVVVWQSFGSSGTDSSSYSIQGQRYQFGLMFADGFESGDTSPWSDQQPRPQ